MATSRRGWGNLQHGTEEKIADRTEPAAGSHSVVLSTHSDTILITLFMSSITSGTFDLKIYAREDEDLETDAKESLLFQFPQLTAATTDILLRRASITTSKIRVEATFTDACSYEIWARGINSGLVDTKIVGAGTLKMSQTTIGTTAAVILAASLLDRAGIVIKNNNTSGILYLGATAGEATTGDGFPIDPGGTFSVDLSAGQEVYGVADSGTIDVRISEAGG